MGVDESGQPPGQRPAAEQKVTPGPRLKTLDEVSAFFGQASDEPLELRDRLRRHLATVVKLPELQMRVAKIGHTLANMPVRDAAWWLDQLVRGAIWGDQPSYDAMLACARWLIETRRRDDYDLLERLYREAHRQNRRVVLNLLRDPPPHRSLPDGKSLPPARLPFERDVSVGERRQIARRAQRKLLDHLLLDPSPLVVSRILQNPSLRAADVLRIASRRPNTPEILWEILRVERWFKRHQVRKALVLNPYNATGSSLRLLPTLGVQTLREVRNSRSIHPAVTQTARDLVDLREQHTAPWRI